MYGAHLQLFILTSRAHAILKKLNSLKQKPDILILDRSMNVGDYVFAKLTSMSDTDRMLYENMQKQMMEMCNVQPNAYFLIDCPPHEAMRRIEKRDNNVHAITIDYLTKLHECHMSIFSRSNTSDDMHIIPNYLKCTQKGTIIDNDITTDSSDSMVYLTTDEMASRMCSIVVEHFVAHSLKTASTSSDPFVRVDLFA